MARGKRKGGVLSENEIARRIVNEDMGARKAATFATDQGRKRGMTGNKLGQWAANMLFKADMILERGGGNTTRGRFRNASGSGSSGGNGG